MLLSYPPVIVIPGLSVRRLPDTLYDPSNDSRSDEIIRAWTNYLGDTELVSSEIESLLVMCSDGTGWLTGAIPDEPEYRRYENTSFEWSITRSDDNAGSEAGLVLRFDPPLDAFLWKALDTPVSRFGESERHIWESGISTEDTLVHHRIGNNHRDDKAMPDTGERIGVVAETNECN